MGAFYYVDRAVPDALVALSRLFDVVIILCSQNTCAGQQAAWPATERHRVCVADFDILGQTADFDSVPHGDSHGIRVGFAYGNMFGYCQRRLGLTAADIATSTYLTMEEDYMWLDEAFDLATLGRFVRSGDWDILRFGYNPVPSQFNATWCAARCRCTRVSQHVCFTTTKCDVRSTVGQSFSPQGAELMKNFSDRIMTGNFFHQLVAGKFWKGGLYDIDMYITSIDVVKVVYHVPGLITDSTPKFLKEQFHPRMKAFATACPL